MKKILLLTGLLLMVLSSGWAQQKQVTGQVIDVDGNPVVAATIVISGTTTGTTADAEGHFTLTAKMGDELEVSSIGYDKQLIAVPADNAPLTITLQSNSQRLNEMVVTALGIKQERKSLGYGVQEIKGQALTDAHEPNVTNALTGKIAGLQVVRSSNGPAGSSKILLRGYSSLTGDNQPLIVVDGIPIDNFTGMTNNDFWNPSMDMGNGLSDINPNDIASLTVLKGPSAAALYGSRAGNGVILITTKSGQRNEGLGITVSSSLGLSTLFTGPEMQTAFGQGTNGIFDPQSAASWGPEAKGQTVTNWNDEQEPLRTYDNAKHYARTGITNKQNISFSQKYESVSIYSSFNRLNDQGITPGVKYDRINMMTRAISNFGPDDRWTLDAKVQYNNSKALNRPQGGTNVSNVFHTLYLLPTSLDITRFDPSVDALGNMIWYAPTSTVNPYWAANYRLNSDERNRYIMNVSLQYRFTDWLEAKIKAGTDRYHTNAETKVHDGSPIVDGGSYTLDKNDYGETDYSIDVTARKENLAGKLGGNVTVGGNLMHQKSSGLHGNSGALQVPNLFTLNNGKNNPTVSHSYTERKINSVYGSVGLSWDDYLYLTATFRNDWSSTLSPENRSYFYPSVNVSYVLSEMLANKPAWLSYAKLRASAASVGNSLPAYQLYNTYTVGKDPNGNTTADKNKVLYDPSVRSELIKSYEAGFDARFFDYRLGIDFSWYRSNATRQLIDLPMDPLSGYSSKKVNAGNIQNSGIEVVVDANVLRNPNALNWDMMVNFSTNSNVVKALTSDISRYQLGGYDDIQIMAATGLPFGEIYGSRLLRVEDKESPYYGKLLLTGDGLPQIDPERARLGNQQADFLLGVTNTFRYKDLSLSFQVDGRFGGKIFSATLANMEALGTAAMTAPGGKRPDLVVDGVVQTGDEKYELNDQQITQQQYWQALQPNNIGITEANLYDATNIRLRTIQLSYNLPARLLQNSPIQRASIGVSCNNVWLISSHMHGLDPESVFATGTNAVGFENASPPTIRQFLFNVSLSF